MRPDKPIRSVSPPKAGTARARWAGPPKARARRGERRTRRRAAAPLVSRKWSGKTLADHRGDRQAWLTGMLGLPAADPTRYRWEQVQPQDEDYLPASKQLLRSVGDRLRWESALAEARRRARDALAAEVSATGRAA
jgi:hypothetical protein